MIKFPAFKKKCSYLHNYFLSVQMLEIMCLSLIEGKNCKMFWGCALHRLHRCSLLVPGMRYTCSSLPHFSWMLLLVDLKIYSCIALDPKLKWNNSFICKTFFWRFYVFDFCLYTLILWRVSRKLVQKQFFDILLGCLDFKLG